MRFNRYPGFPNRFHVFRLAFDPGSVFPAREGGKKEIKVHTKRTFTFRCCAYDTLAREIIARSAPSCIVMVRRRTLFSACGFFATRATRATQSVIHISHLFTAHRSVSLIRVHRARFTEEVEWKAALLVSANANRNFFFPKAATVCVTKAVLGEKTRSEWNCNFWI